LEPGAVLAKRLQQDGAVRRDHGFFTDRDGRGLATLAVVSAELCASQSRPAPQDQRCQWLCVPRETCPDVKGVPSSACPTKLGRRGTGLVGVTNLSPRLTNLIAALARWTNHRDLTKHPLYGAPSLDYLGSSPSASDRTGRTGKASRNRCRRSVAVSIGAGGVTASAASSNSPRDQT
jgi:hypothetical protein